MESYPSLSDIDIGREFVALDFPLQMPQSHGWGQRKEFSIIVRLPLLQIPRKRACAGCAQSSVIFSGRGEAVYQILKQWSRLQVKHHCCLCSPNEQWRSQWPTGSCSNAQEWSCRFQQLYIETVSPGDHKIELFGRLVWISTDNKFCMVYVEQFQTMWVQSIIIGL